MEYNYNFSTEEKKILYKELKKIINSDDYKLLRREYNKLINQIAKNVYKLNLDDPFSAAYLLNKEITYKLENQTKDELDLDVLYKLWGSRVFTNSFSNRHIVSLINDILIKSGYVSCKILTCKENVSVSIVNNNQKTPNHILLCIIINNKKIFYDIKENELLKINKILSNSSYNCYLPLINKNKKLYFVNNNDDNNLEINEEHLFVLNDYIFSEEYNKKDFGSKAYVKDYISFLEEQKTELLTVKENNISTIVSLNNDLSKKQNEIYRKVKKL